MIWQLEQGDAYYKRPLCGLVQSVALHRHVWSQKYLPDLHTYLPTLPTYMPACVLARVHAATLFSVEMVVVAVWL